MNSPILDTLLAKKIVKHARPFTVNGSAGKIEGFIVRGHETMGVVLHVTDDWRTIYVEGIRWGSYGQNDRRLAIVKFLALTWESTESYAAEKLAEFLGETSTAEATR